MGKIDWSEKHFLISRTDSIGDVVLTLPMAAWLKQKYPTCRVTFLCRSYTAPIVRKYQAVDAVIVLDEFNTLDKKAQIDWLTQQQFDSIIHVFPNKKIARRAKSAKIKDRIGTSHRIFHWFTCTILPNFTRKKSTLHEAQLNFELLRPFGLVELPTMKQLNDSCQHFVSEKLAFPFVLPEIAEQKIICLHPKSQGSAKEWPIENYITLTHFLLEKNYIVCFTGTENEGKLFRHLLPIHQRCIDTTGQLTIDELCWLIHESTALVACSTGPLHLAGMIGIRAVGLFSPKKPIHPGRWKPLGAQSTALVFDEDCATCHANQPCNCIELISPKKVLAALFSTDETAH